MKTGVIIGIAAGLAVLGVLLIFASYQQAELSSEYEEIVIELDTVYLDDVEEMQKEISSEESNPQEP